MKNEEIEQESGACKHSHSIMKFIIEQPLIGRSWVAYLGGGGHIKAFKEHNGVTFLGEKAKM